MNSKRLIIRVSTFFCILGVLFSSSCQLEKGRTNSVVTDIDALTVKPEFKGNVHQYIAENTKYPIAAQEQCLEGSVIVKFVINEDGSITGVHSDSKEISPLLSDAAIAAVAEMPNWVPGEIDGNKVKTAFRLPFTFVLPDKVNDDVAIEEVADIDETQKVLQGAEGHVDTTTELPAEAYNQIYYYFIKRRQITSTYT